MRKNALALSIAAMIGSLGFVGAATADVIPGTGVPGAATLGLTNATDLQVNNGGLGHALVTPYYTAQDNNGTIISITNSDLTNGKAVKVRFRGASNSDDVLDFTVLMSPGDIWNATITRNLSTGIAQLATADRTCTVPQLAPNVQQSFVTNRLTSKGANDIPTNTREGYIEMFNMADIQPGTALFTAIKHVNGIPPCTSTTINAAVFNTNFTTEAAAAAQGFATPTTGLFGSWVILDVARTLVFSGEMSAIRAVAPTAVPGVVVDGRANFVVFPQNGSAYIAPAGTTISNVTADPIFRVAPLSAKNFDNTLTTVVAGPAIAAAFFDMPDMSTPYVTMANTGNDRGPLVQAGSLTASLAVKTIMNDYVNDAVIAAKTDWLFSMPTRRYSVAMDYFPATSRRLYSSVPPGAGANGAGGPTPQYFHDANTPLNTVNSQQICVSSTSVTFLDREEATKTSGAVFSPGNVTTTQFCGETSVLSFADTGSSSAVLRASVARQDTGSSAFSNGWGIVNTTDASTGLGLPILGYSFISAFNSGATPGVSGNYGITDNHRFTR